MVDVKHFGFESKEEVEETLRRCPDIRFMRFITADMHGERPCGFTVPVSELNGQIRKDGDVIFKVSEEKNNMFIKGFDASSLYPERINESDKNASFDFTTARVIPWSYRTMTDGYERRWREMVIFGDVIDPGNNPYKYDSRNILKKVLVMLSDRGIADTVYIGPELEFFLFEADEAGDPIVEEFHLDDCRFLRPLLVDKGTYFKGGKYGQIRKEAQMVLQEMGYRFEYDHHEVSNSQHEIDVNYLPALEMADLVMLYRYVVKKVAFSYGLFASFMPKPITGQNGNGMHTHQSLYKDGKNIFHDPDDRNGLSLDCRRYITGLMAHVSEITAVLNPWVNSYKRLVPGYEAPVYICCDIQNRSSLIRIPGYDLSSPDAIRIELRNPDPSCNPYLSFALQIAAGARGIIEGAKPAAIQEINVFEMTEDEMAELGIMRLPPDLSTSLDLLDTSPLAREVMGEDLLKNYLSAKRAHIEAYGKSLGHRKDDRSLDVQISRFEIEHLLPIL